MKRRVCFPLAILIIYCFNPAYGQGSEKDIHTEVPTSPAFTVLGFEPSAVMRPTSTAELKANLFSAFDNGQINPNVGIEFAPYWFKSRDNLTYDKYIDPTAGQAFVQSSQFSLAYVEDSVSKQGKFGIGYRFQLKSGKPTANFTNQYKKVVDDTKVAALINSTRLGIRNGTISTRHLLIAQIKTNIQNEPFANPQEIINEIEDFAQSIIGNYTDSKSDILSFMQEINDYYLSSKDENAQALLDMADKGSSRYGWFVEFGMGTSLINDSGKDIDLDGYGVWGTGSYRWLSGGQFTWSLRVLGREGDTSQINGDLGISYAHSIFEGATISVEGVGRFYDAEYQFINSDGGTEMASMDDFTYRFAATLTFNITSAIYVNLSLGKGFTDTMIQNNSFFSLAGINYDLFKPSKSLPPL